MRSFSFFFFFKKKREQKASIFMPTAKLFVHTTDPTNIHCISYKSRTVELFNALFFSFKYLGLTTHRRPPQAVENIRR